MHANKVGNVMRLCLDECSLIFLMDRRERKGLDINYSCARMLC